MTTSPTPRNQIEDTNDVALSSPDFSKLTTDVGDNPYVRRPHPSKAPPFLRGRRLQLLGCENCWKIAKHNLLTNPKPKQSWLSTTWRYDYDKLNERKLLYRAQTEPVWRF